MQVWLGGTEAFVKNLCIFDFLCQKNSGDDLLKTNWKYIYTGNTIVHIFFRMNNPSIWASV